MTKSKTGKSLMRAGMTASRLNTHAMGTPSRLRPTTRKMRRGDRRRKYLLVRSKWTGGGLVFFIKFYGQFVPGNPEQWPSAAPILLGLPVTNEGGGKRRAGMLDQDARSTLTTLNRGSRSTWMFKTKPSGQVESARRSATVFAVTEIPCSTSTLMLSR
jgi:hypothetical protein